MKKNLIIPALFITAMMIIPMSCKSKIPSDLTRESIIPKPVSITATGDCFTLNKKTVIFVSDKSEEMINMGNYLAEMLNPVIGFSVKLNTASEGPKSGKIIACCSH